jgi:hypothetical protein
VATRAPYKDGYQRLGRNLVGCRLLAGTYEKSHSITLPAHPREMGIMTWSESAHLYRVKTDISAVLMDTSGLDSHTMSKLDSHGYLEMDSWQGCYLMFGRMAIPCYLGLLPHVTNGGCYLYINNYNDDD